MKNLCYVLFMIIALLGCNSEPKKINLKEIKQLILSDSLSQIGIYTPNKAILYKKVKQKKTDQYIYIFDNKNELKDSLESFEKQAAEKNKIPSVYNYYEVNTIESNLAYMEIFILILNILSITLLIWAVISIAKTVNISSESKIIWLLIVLFIPLLGPIIYLLKNKKV